MSSPIANFLVTAELLARQAGEILVQSMGRIKSISLKARRDLVTEVDKASEAFIVAGLQSAFADHGIVAEEEHRLREKAEWVWLIDPVDGTMNYVHGYPYFNVSIGLLHHGERVGGVVFDPLHRELFRAARGQGATCNGESIHVTGTADMADSLLATGFPYFLNDRERNNLEFFRRMAYETQGIRRSGSAALDLCYVAMGRLEGFWELGLKPWDLCAATVVVEEAGGKVSLFDGSPLDLEVGDVLATNGHIHEAVVAVLKG